MLPWTTRHTLAVIVKTIALELLLKRSLSTYVQSWLQISDQLPWENTRVGQVKVQAAISTCFWLDWLFKMFLPF